MAAVDGEEPVGQQPAPVPTRTVRLRVAGGLLVRPRAVPPEADSLPATVAPVEQLLAAAVRLPPPGRTAPPPARRQRAPKLPRPRHWYLRPMPAAMAVGGLVTVAATGLADGLAPGAPASGAVPAQRSGSGPGGTLRGARLVPQPGPTPDEVPPSTVTPAAPAPVTEQPTSASTSAGPLERTRKPKRLRKPRRSRTGPASGTDRSSTGSTGSTGSPTGDPTGQVTIGPQP